MARVGISITKSTPFRDSVQEWANVYYYQNTASLPSASGADAMIDELVVMEKTFHSSVVTFVRGRVWSQEGSPGANNMISQKALSGVGAQSINSNLDKERAFLFRFRAGVDSRGLPVYLRKWYHSCGEFESLNVPLSATLLANTTGFSTGQRTFLVNKMHGISTLTSGGGGWEIVAKGGRQRSPGGDWEAHKYLEHHQLGDMWRG